MGIIEESFRLYWGNSDCWILYVLSLVYLLLVGKKRERQNILFWYTCMVMVIILNPAFSWIVQRLINSSETYVRVYYLLPICTIMAYAGQEIVMKQKKNAGKWITLFLLILVLAFSGTSYYEKNAYQNAENIYKIPDEHKQIADAIIADLEDGENAKVLTTLWDPKWNYIRQYTRRIIATGDAMPYWNFGNEEAYWHGDMLEYIAHMEEEGYEFDYIIQNKMEGMRENFEEGGHEILLETDNYLVVKIFH